MATCPLCSLSQSQASYPYPQPAQLGDSDSYTPLRAGEPGCSWACSLTRALPCLTSLSAASQVDSAYGHGDLFDPGDLQVCGEQQQDGAITLCLSSCLCSATSPDLLDQQDTFSSPSPVPEDILCAMACLLMVALPLFLSLGPNGDRAAEE